MSSAQEGTAIIQLSDKSRSTLFRCGKASQNRRIALEKPEDNTKLTDHADGKTHVSEKEKEQNSDNFGRNTSEENDLDELMKMSRQFAHRLNNLLTTILANTQLVLLIAQDEELKPYLTAVEDASRDAGKAIRKFQESSRSLALASSSENLLGQSQKIAK